MGIQQKLLREAVFSRAQQGDLLMQKKAGKAFNRWSPSIAKKKAEGLIDEVIAGCGSNIVTGTKFQVANVHAFSWLSWMVQPEAEFQSHNETALSCVSGLMAVPYRRSRTDRLPHGPFVEAIKIPVNISGHLIERMCARADLHHVDEVLSVLEDAIKIATVILHPCATSVFESGNSPDEQMPLLIPCPGGAVLGDFLKKDITCTLRTFISLEDMSSAKDRLITDLDIWRHAHAQEIHELAGSHRRWLWLELGVNRGFFSQKEFDCSRNIGDRFVAIHKKHPHALRALDKRKADRNSKDAIWRAARRQAQADSKSASLV